VLSSHDNLAHRGPSDEPESNWDIPVKERLRDHHRPRAEVAGESIGDHAPDAAAAIALVLQGADGPAVIEEYGSTTVVWPGDRFEIGGLREIRIQCAAK